MQKAEKIAEFVNTIVGKTEEKLVLFFDESRLGRHSKLGHCWFKTGEKAKMPVKLDFENFYFYSAVNPKTGTDFSLKSPTANTACMSAFLEHFATSIVDEKIVLIMDGASWHRSRLLKVLKNIEFYCYRHIREFNLVEGLWLYVKQNTIKNKVFNTIVELKDMICEFMKNLNIEVAKNVCGYRILE